MVLKRPQEDSKIYRLDSILTKKEKRTQKRCCCFLLQVKDLISSSGLKNFVHISIMHQTSFCGAQNFVPENNFVAIL